MDDRTQVVQAEVSNDTAPNDPPLAPELDTSTVTETAPVPTPEIQVEPEGEVAGQGEGDGAVEDTAAGDAAADAHTVRVEVAAGADSLAAAEKEVL